MKRHCYLSPLSSMSPSSPPLLPEAPSQLQLCAGRWGQGTLCASSSTGSGLFVSVFNGILQCQPGHCFFTLFSDPSSLIDKALIDASSEQPLDQICSCTGFYTGVKLDFLGVTLELQQHNWKWNQASEPPLFPWLRRTELSVWTFECEWSWRNGIL